MVLTRAADRKALKLAAPGPAGHVRVEPRPRGLPGRAGLRPCARRTGSFPISATWALYLTLGYPLAAYYHYWMGNEAGLRTPDGLNLFPSPSPSASQIPQAVGAGLAAKYLEARRWPSSDHVRRRRDLGRRFPRGAEFRRRLPDAQRLRLLQQPVGHLRAAVAPDRVRDHRPEGRRLRLPRRPGRRQRRPGRLRRGRRGPGPGPGGRRADPHRGLHLPDGRPHDLGRRRRATGPRTRSRSGSGAIRSPASGSTSRDKGLWDEAFEKAVQDAAADRRREGRRRGRGPARRPRPRTSSPTPTRRCRRDLDGPAGRAQGLAPGGTADDHDHGPGHQPGPAPARWSGTTGSSSSARTSAATAASSGSPRGCSTSSAPSGSSTRRSPSPASSGRRSAWPPSASGPCAEIQFMGFIYPAFNQIVSHVARLRNRTRGRFTAPLTIRTPYGAGVKALEHHSESTEALFCQIPGPDRRRPLEPATTPRACSRPRSAATTRSSSSNRPGSTAPKSRRSPRSPTRFPCARPRIVREGRDLTIVAWGAMIPVARKAAEPPPKPRASRAEIVDLRTLSPMDRETILASVRKTGRALVLHEAPKTCGLGRGDRGHDRRDGPPQPEGARSLRVTAPDITVPCPRARTSIIPNAERVLRADPQAHGVLTWPKNSAFPTSAKASPRAKSSAGSSRRATRSRPTRPWPRSRPTRPSSRCRLPTPAPSSSSISRKRTSSRSASRWSPSAKRARALAEPRRPRRPGRPAGRRRAAAAPAPAAAARGEPGEILATPRVRALAKELGVDLGRRPGTGPGRARHRGRRPRRPRPAPAGTEARRVKIKAKYDLYGTLERIPLRGVRRATAKKMRESLDHAAHVTHFDEADAGRARGPAASG